MSAAKKPPFPWVTPLWLVEFKHSVSRQSYPDDQSRMELAISLSSLNVEHHTGGPFGAAVFNCQTGALVSVGVNLVEASHSSLAHAEIVALMAAQASLRTARLSDRGEYALVTSAQPCCQCYGVCVWAGLKELVIAASTKDTESLTGFDEGPLPERWKSGLASRGIQVRTGVMRKEARAVLRDYNRSGGTLY